MSNRKPPLPWDESIRDPRSPQRDAFIESHLGFVRAVAARITSRLPASVDHDDMYQEGVIGLLEAIDRYDPARGVPFPTYAEQRIQGAILDGLRRRDWRPRSVRSKQRQIDAAVCNLQARHRRHANEEEIADAVGMSLDQYRNTLISLRVGPLLSFDDLPPQDLEAALVAEERPDAIAERSDLLVALSDEIDQLPPRELQVLRLYYYSRLNMKEVGAVMGVTESRVCQLHSQAASRLRSAMNHRASAPREAMRATAQRRR